VREGRALVSRTEADGDLKGSIGRALAALGGLERLVEPGDEVLLKPNYNSDDRSPATTDPAFLRAVTELVREAGAARVIIGDSSGLPWLPTSRVLRNLGITEELAEMADELLLFDELDFVRVRIGGSYLDSIGIAERAYRASKIIYLSCMKTHRLARFTMSLKMAMGLTDPGDRPGMHMRNLEEKLAEVNVAVAPDLVIMDGRKAFITGGPDKGEVVEPGLIFCSADPVATDVEALKILQSYHGRNRIEGDVWQLPLLRHSVEMGVGVAGEAEYEVIAA
jgi:uncharacterized protein (DUF362 family)